MDLNKGNKFTGLAHAAKSWENLPVDEKSEYITQAEESQKAYSSKRQECNNSISTSYRPAKSPFSFFVADQKYYPDNLPQG
jgi:hypothetical protein